jgi:hypothetical protein
VDLRGNVRVLARVLLVPFVPVVLWISIFDGPLEPVHPFVEILIRSLFFLAGVGLIIYLINGTRAPVRDSGLTRPIADNPSSDGDLDKEIDKSLALVARKYTSPGAIPLFGNLLLDVKLLVRTHDRIDILEQALAVQTSMDYSFDRPPDQQDCDVPIAVPVMEVRKGALLDSFDVTDAAGASLSTLSQHETRGLVGHVVISLYATAYGDERNVLMSSRSRPAALRQLLRLVYRRGRRSSADVRRDYDEAIKGLRMADGPAARFCAERLELLCTFLARHYVVAADMRLQENETRLHLRYRQVTPIYGLIANGRSWLRARMGLRPYIFKIHMPLLYRSGAYHLLLNGEAGQYVQHHAVVDTATGLQLTSADMAARFPGSYLRVREAVGLPFGRLYARGFDRTDRKQLEYLASVITFAEVPPGTLGGAAKVVTVTAALVTLFAFLRPAVTDVSSDAAALLLAAPAAMASWAGYSPERLRQSSLATYFALLIAQVVSVVSAGLYIIERRLTDGADKFFTVHDQGVLGLFRLPDFDWGWLVLSTVSIALLGYLYVLRYLRLRTYIAAKRRSDTTG